MKVDKLNGNVGFIDSTHTYLDVTNPSKQYISVTTLIHNYTQDFDTDFWSSYKSLEKLMDKKAWNIEKRFMLNTHKFNEKLLDIYEIDEKEFNKVKQEILDEWEKKKVDSCERGTKIHADIENSFYKNPKDITLQKFGIGGKFECKKDYYDLDLEYGVYPEYLIYRESNDGILKIAGQIDLIVKQGNELYLIDHKSNAKIDLKSGFNTVTKQSAKMKYPLNTLEDCNFIHYSLQLSTYAWMLQKINPNFIIKDLIINHYDHNGNNTLYHCDYLKKDVEKMLYHYKKEIMLEEKRNKRKKIEY